MSDYISRETNGDDFVRRADIVEKFMDRLPSISVGYLCKVADEIPAAAVRPVKRGEWMDTEDTYAVPPARQTCRCSNCGKVSPRPLGDFCRWCGADMRTIGQRLNDISVEEDLFPELTAEEKAANRAEAKQMVGGADG